MRVSSVEKGRKRGKSEEKYFSPLKKSFYRFTAPRGFCRGAFAFLGGLADRITLPLRPPPPRQSRGEGDIILIRRAKICTPMHARLCGRYTHAPPRSYGARRRVRYEEWTALFGILHPLTGVQNDAQDGMTPLPSRRARRDTHPWRGGQEMRRRCLHALRLVDMTNYSEQRERYTRRPPRKSRRAAGGAV